MSTGVFDNERDPQSFFGDDSDHFDHDDLDDLDGEQDLERDFDDRPRPGPRPVRSDRRADERAAQFRRRRRLVTLGAIAFVALLAVLLWLVVVPLVHKADPADFRGATGDGGTTTVEVRPNDSAQAIGDSLQQAGVIASSAAFVSAATNDQRSTNIQPGSYLLPTHISAEAALADLLDGKHQARGLVIPEGATVVDVEKRLIAPRCTPSTPKTTVCGLGVPEAQAKAALRDVSSLGLPNDYGSPSSAEGFLYPLTYSIGAGTSASDALQQMVNAFIDKVRSTGFTAAARAEHLTPYQALVIASIEQSEAYFPEDMPKVARVILNRLAAKMPLQIDATSAYAAKLKGLDPTKVIYAEVDGPYNSYKHAGLPPTPISNPGEDALNGAVHPADGNWLYYVNADAAGHLFFTNDQTKFAAAVEKCRKNNWGCG